MRPASTFLLFNCQTTVAYIFYKKIKKTVDKSEGLGYNNFSLSMRGFLLGIRQAVRQSFMPSGKERYENVPFFFFFTKKQIS